ncbi:MAG: acetate--CoA ligase family protein [Betaproteobacteria bacterium]|nr:acetate--CoA ligase family protein [Betaproteobacteria bacterium]
MFRSADALLKAKTIAIVGASETGAGGWPKAIYENLEYAGFPAKIYLVNPGRKELWGRKVYPNFASLPEPIDVALMLIPAAAIPDVLAEGAAHGLKCGLIFAARFGEDGNAEGIARAQTVKALCESTGLRVSGPNCMGALAIREKQLLYPASRVRVLPPGPVGVVFQSGGTFMYWLQQAAVRGLGFSYAVSSGNELNLDLADFINFLIEDENTKVITCMVEGVRRPEVFMAVAEKALAAKKPIILVKVGRSERGKAAAKSHTGALAGNDRVFDALCDKTGIVRCPSLDDLIDTTLAFVAGRIPKGARVAMSGFSGGAKGLFLDYASDEGLDVTTFTPATSEKLRGLIDAGVSADNPLDTGAGIASQPKKFSDICKIVAVDPNVDLIAMQGSLPSLPGEQLDPTVFSEVAKLVDKPVIVYGRMAQNVTDEGRKFQQEAGVPFLQGLPETVRALRGLVRYGEALRRPVAPIPAARGKAENLSGPSFDRLLADHGLLPPRSTLARTPEEAAAVAAEIGFPVAVKIASPQASHKTEVGGVALGLTEAAAVRAAAESMTRALRARDPKAAIDGYLVQEMVSGLEMIIGVRADPQFGPFMIVGVGGVFVEALNDVAIRLLPVDEEIAREMLLSLRAKSLLGAFRGKLPRDVAAVARAVAGLSRLFLDHREWLSDLEVNPLIVLAEGEGARAVDVRAVPR